MNLWDRLCNYYRYYPQVGIALDLSTMRFDEDFLEGIKPKLETAFSEMEALEAGAIANADEKRMVGHYWLRTPELSPSSEIEQQILGEQARVRKFANDIVSGAILSSSGEIFNTVVIVGIGGSALGPQLLSQALWSAGQPVQIYLSDNTDPDGLGLLLDKLADKLKTTLVLITSKSGGTVETRNGMLEFKVAYEQQGLDFSKHAVAITVAGSKLDSLAREQGWLCSFYIWDWVGGRTSLFSAVGLLPAALQGIDISALLEGAKLMDECTRVANLDNPAALLAAMWYYAGGGRGSKDMVVIPYKDRLELFSRYLQQLIMESLGKGFDRDGNKVNQGIAVYGNKGSTDQHAYMQQLREGLDNFFVTFVTVLDSTTQATNYNSTLEVESRITSGDYLNGFYQGTKEALYEGGRESITICLDRLDALTLGALIALYERAVGLYASLINVNAYHQPGVEAGKRAAGEVIDLQRKLQTHLFENQGKELSVEQLATTLNEPKERVFVVLEHLAGNSKGKIVRTGPRSPIQARYCFCGSS